ncbi:MAG: hypothetical protein NVSMB55_25720 [Mycobacteriales bacterium]
MTYEAGRVGVGAAVHAVERTLTGPGAGCGAGPMATRIPGRVDRDSDLTCLACAHVDSSDPAFAR